VRNDEFIGGEFVWFTGIVKDINDTEYLNRVKVNCLGFYDEAKDNELPWATVMMPATSGSIKGVGMNHNLQVGSWVVGFFRDGPSAQDPVVMGSIATQTGGTDDEGMPVLNDDGEPTYVKDIPTEAQVSGNTNHVYRSQSGHLIEVDNTEDDETLRVTHAKGAVIVIDKDNNLSITNSGNTVLSSTGNIDFSSLNGNINMKAPGPITITSATKTTVV